MRFLVVGILGAAFALQACASNGPAVGWYNIRLPDGRVERIEYDLKQCQMVGWKSSYKLDASLDILNKYKGKGGFEFSAEESRNLDTLQTDLGVKFEVNCRTYLMTNRTDDDRFKCEVGKLGLALDQLRALNTILETIKSDQDATTKKEIVLQALNRYSEILSKDCTKGISLSKDILRIIFQTAYEDSFSVINGSAVKISWACKNKPHGFEAKETECKGELTPKTIGKEVPIIRKILVGRPTQDFEEYFFSIEATNGENKPLKIETDNLFSTIQLPKHLDQESAIKAARTAVTSASKSGPNNLLMDRLAATLLYNNGYYEGAKQLFEKVADSNPHLTEDPTFLYNMTFVHYRTGDFKKGDNFRTKLADLVLIKEEAFVYHPIGDLGPDPDNFIILFGRQHHYAIDTKALELRKNAALEMLEDVGVEKKMIEPAYEKAMEKKAVTVPPVPHAAPLPQPTPPQH